MKNKTRELMGAHSVLIILLILKQGNSYGYKIMKEVAKLSDNEIIWKEGSLYPVLKRLESDGLIESYWDTTKTPRARKYFKILKPGFIELELIIKQREKFNHVIDELIIESKK